jgi:FkbM family methyltransferase
MLNVCCVYFGDAFSKEYVFILQDMVRRNLPQGFRGQFVVFTDSPETFEGAPGIVTRRLPSGLNGWWNKLALFDDGVFPKGDRVLYFDLDVVITGPLDKIAEYKGDFAILEDPWRFGTFNSSVMLWEAGTKGHIYTKWLEAGMPNTPGGDQSWITQVNPVADSLQGLFPGRLKSYKAHAAREGIQPGTSVVYFHGRPRPHEVTDGWVPDIWRIGGGSTAELIMIGTVAQDIVLNNMRSAIAKDYRMARKAPKHDGLAVICAGGPGLNDNLGMVANLQAGGASIFAVNGVAKHLVDRGVSPEYHVMVDARPQMLDMVVPGPTQLFSSMMDPAVLEAADDLICWHPITEGGRDVAGKTLYVGGGTTVGCKAVALAYMFGFRRLFLVGFDSSYSDDGGHHAYPQKLNDKDRILEVICDGRTFKAAPWHVKQTEDLKIMWLALNAECEFTVVGDGLWPHMFAGLLKEAQGYRLDGDGLWWPTGDARGHIAATIELGDLFKYMALCPRKDVAVQAGGNVGVWPKELAKHFKQVVTFEPDLDNYECLRRNVTEQNVDYRNVALGDSPGSVTMHRVPGNCGASYVANTGVNEVPQITLDSLELAACDLLQLDVEGYELKALKGAKQTIDRFSPVIVLEQKGLGLEYGHGDSDEDAAEWLSKLGYKRTGAMHRDVIYTRTI